MIRVSVMYPNTADVRFDHVYYVERHMPMLQERLGATCLAWTVDRGLGGAMPGMPAPYVAIGHFTCPSLQAFQQAMAPHAAAIMADIPNYTNAQPVIQISEVVA